MKDISSIKISLLSTIFSISGSVTAQTPTSAPPINESETIKITTTLIKTDVTLTDKNDKVILDKFGSALHFVAVPDFKKQMSISNLLVDNFTPEEWRKISLGGDRDASERSLLLDTTLRRFKNGTVLRYDYAIYNPKKSQSLSTRLRLVRDGKTIYEEPPVAIKTAGQTDLSRLQIEGTVTLGKNLEPGDYILQITADDGSGEKNAASQFVQFEIIK